MQKTKEKSEMMPIALETNKEILRKKLETIFIKRSTEIGHGIFFIIGFQGRE
jgi:hypothetical protein